MEGDMEVCQTKMKGKLACSLEDSKGSAIIAGRLATNREIVEQKAEMMVELTRIPMQTLNATIATKKDIISQIVLSYRGKRIKLKPLLKNQKEKCP